jgi:hypothetical protein
MPPFNGSKIGHVSTNRTVAQMPKPADTTGGSENRTFVDTYFTKAPVDGEPTEIIYNGDRMWAKITLTLETAGPVAVGNSSSITPVLSGKGQLLETDVPAVFFISKGTRLYVAAAGINRVKRIVEAVPWLETITGLLGSLIGVSRPTAAAVVVATKSKL